MAHFYFDIETCPVNREDYSSRDEDGRKKLLNPIDSRIVAIGLKVSGREAIILQDGDEKKMLDGFWSQLAGFKKGSAANKLVGFNVKDFDLPFLVTRSFILGSTIVPFLLKDVLDLRESISAFTYRHTRGKLKEFAELIGIEIIEGFEGKDVAETYWAGDNEKIAQYLRKDLEITEAMAERMVKLRITEIQKW